MSTCLWNRIHLKLFYDFCFKYWNLNIVFCWWQTYGFENNLSLQQLERAGLLRVQEQKTYPTIRKTLKLVMEDVNEQVLLILPFIHWSFMPLCLPPCPLLPSLPPCLPPSLPPCLPPFHPPSLPPLPSLSSLSAFLLPSLPAPSLPEECRIILRADSIFWCVAVRWCWCTQKYG